jgi:hypothetical protein
LNRDRPFFGGSEHQHILAFPRLCAFLAPSTFTVCLMIEPFIATIYDSNDKPIEIDLEPLVYDEWLTAEGDAPAE